MKMNIIHKLLALSAAGFITATVAQAQTSIPVSNGSFELPGSPNDYNSNDYTAGTADSSFPDWTISNGTAGHFFITNDTTSHSTIPNGSFYSGYWFQGTAGVDASLTCRICTSCKRYLIS